MYTEDNTGKSKVEWSKSIINQALENLNEEDFLSLVIFDDKTETILESQKVTDKVAIRKTYESLEPRGGTDLFAGTKQGFENTYKNSNPNYENRVILISDAGWNTGNTDDTDLLRLISNYANETIGLTAIGLGENFNQELIHQITMSRGGNYLFVHSGKEIGEIF